MSNVWPTPIFLIIFHHRPLISWINPNLRPICFLSRVPPPPPRRQGIKNNFDQNVICKGHGLVVETSTFPMGDNILQGLQFLRLQYLYKSISAVSSFSQSSFSQHPSGLSRYETKFLPGILRP